MDEEVVQDVERQLNSSQLDHNHPQRWVQRSVLKKKQISCPQYERRQNSNGFENVHKTAFQRNANKPRWVQQKVPLFEETER